MASWPTTCVICGKPCRLIGSGGATQEDLREGPQVHTPGTQGDEDCWVEWERREAARRVQEAAAQLAAARALVAEADAAVAETSPDPHTFTVAELKAFADSHGINLGDATLKADIRGRIIEALNMTQLREFARLEGIEFTGSNLSRDELVAQMNAEPEPGEPPWEPPSEGGPPPAEGPQVEETTFAP